MSTTVGVTAADGAHMSITIADPVIVALTVFPFRLPARFPAVGVKLPLVLPAKL